MSDVFAWLEVLGDCDNEGSLKSFRKRDFFDLFFAIKGTEAATGDESAAHTESDQLDHEIEVLKFHGGGKIGKVVVDELPRLGLGRGENPLPFMEEGLELGRSI